MAAPILADHFSEDVETFQKDLLLLLSIVYGLDREYGAADDNFGPDLAKFKEMAYDWNLKYRHLILRIPRRGSSFAVKLLLNEPDLKKVMLDAAIRLGDIVSINRRSPGVNLFTEKMLRHVLKSVTDHLDIVYKVDGKENSLTLEHDSTYDRVAVVYEKEDMLDPDSPEFLICAYYALMGYNDSINLSKYAGEFSFDTDILARKGRGDGWDRSLPKGCLDSNSREY